MLSNTDRRATLATLLAALPVPCPRSPTGHHAAYRVGGPCVYCVPPVEPPVRRPVYHASQGVRA